MNLSTEEKRERRRLSKAAYNAANKDKIAKEILAEAESATPVVSVEDGD